jgi:hypothetical protein
MFGKKKFQRKTIGDTPNYKSYGDILHPSRKWSVMKILLIIACVFLVFYMSKYVISFVQGALGQITKGAVNVVSNSMGEAMTGDEFGNINVMIV